MQNEEIKDFTLEMVSWKNLFDSEEDLFSTFGIFKKEEYPEKWELYATIELDDDGFQKTPVGLMLWLPDDGSAAIEYGADAYWMDAHDPQDAAYRYYNDDMA